MKRHHKRTRPIYSTLGMLTAALIVFGVGTAQAGRYDRDVAFSDAAVSSDNLSGFKGTAFVVGVPDADGNDDYAVFGLASEEQRDHPCYVTVHAENINDSSGKQDLKKELCDGQEQSSEIAATFADSNYGKRSFVTGVRVCLNNDNDRVKGIQIRGQSITDYGALGKLERGAATQQSGNIAHLYPEEPKDQRPNCNNNWKRWALCPGSNQVATAVVLHFEAGKQPRSLIGVGLQCRTVKEAEPVTGTPF